MYAVVESISAAYYAALLRDLPDIGSKTWILAGQEHTIEPRRPNEDDVEVWSFPEQWGSTALGYGGMGGNVMTIAQTTIVACRETNSAALYWGPGGRLGKLMTYSKAREAVDKQHTSR